MRNRFLFCFWLLVLLAVPGFALLLLLVWISSCSPALQLNQGSAQSVSKKVSFAILEDYDKGEDLNEVAKDFQLMRELEIDTLRCSFGWDDYEPVRGQYDFVWLKEFVKLAAQHRIPIVPRADSGWYLLVPLVIAGVGLGLLVSQLNNYSLAPIDDERISEAAGVNSASGSFGLSFGLAMAGGILLATLSLAFTNLTNASPVIPSTQQQQIAQTLEDDAQVVSNTQLDEVVAGEPQAVQDEVRGINTDATNLALQVALLVPILAGIVGLFSSFRMVRLADVTPAAPLEGAVVA